MPTPRTAASMPRETPLALNDKLALISTIESFERELERRSNYKFNRYFPDTGELRRELYTGALEFFRAGARYPERMLMGGNRTGKTEAAAYEVTCHMTGLYPHWWEGRRFDGPTDWWAAGDTATTTRDIQQLALFGPLKEAPKTGMIPGHLVEGWTHKTSIPNGIETIWIKHALGGKSTIQFKSYDQRREAFQGTSRNIWFDEECPEDVYIEALLRTLTPPGIMIVTFTPVEGLTPFVQTRMEQGVMMFDDATTETRRPGPAEVVMFGGADDDLIKSETRLPVEKRNMFINLIRWDEVPHLSEAAKQQMLASIPPYQRAARTQGIPHLGSGVIYPIPEEDIKVNPFDIPAHWPRGFGMDVGWNWTVAVWGAYDRESGTWFLYKEHVRSHAEPPVHAAGILGAGDWIPGRIDPAANGRSQADGRQLLQMYRDLGLKIDVAPNAVEAGIHEVWTLMTAGRLKVFSSLTHYFTEYRMYRRDGKGRVVKSHDHVMDAKRYLIASGIEWLQTGPAYDLLRKHGRANNGGDEDEFGEFVGYYGHTADSYMG